MVRKDLIGIIQQDVVYVPGTQGTQESQNEDPQEDPAAKLDGDVGCCSLRFWFLAWAGFKNKHCFHGLLNGLPRQSSWVISSLHLPMLKRLKFQL